MNRLFRWVSGTLFILLFGITFQTMASQEAPLFLLGDNEKAEIVWPKGKPIALPLGMNPLEVITSKAGRKIFLCAGETNKEGKILQGAFIGIVDKDLKDYERVIQLDSKLTAYEMDKEATVLWLTTRGGLSNEEEIAPKLLRLDLSTFELTECVLDSIPCELALASHEHELAVACLGDLDHDRSTVIIFNAHNLQPFYIREMPKNPGYLEFSEDGDSLVAAGYGYRDEFTIPTEYSIKMAHPISAGAVVLDLVDRRVKTIDLGAVHGEFVIGRNNTIYGVTKAENQSIVKAMDATGFLWQNSCDFGVEYIQEQPEGERTFVMGGKRLRILQKDNGQVVKDHTLENDLKPFLFPRGSAQAFAYNVDARRLNILNIDALEIEQTVKAGSGGLAALRAAVTVLSLVELYNSYQPRYVGGVRLPRRISHNHWGLWDLTSRGNIVACPDQNKLFMLNSYLNRIFMYDMKKGTIEKQMGGIGQETKYLQLAPNGKYVVLVTGDKWRLINTSNGQSALTFNPCGVNVRLAFQESKAPTPYFSPDGTRMFIPKGSKVTVVDLENGKKLANISTQTKDALVGW